ncbi:hypothetical protein [Streptomyces sp. R44]|uniref:Uncharacterized protein n=1 Tax=Streptomyces sp. R44 TaxID=3238633 RepID=A0AB39T832_9ACTN
MRWERPAAGREPAAAALLGWLADPHAPRLCLVSGSAGCGKSGLLAWLVHHGTRSGTAAERAVHAVVPSAGRSAAGTVWALADQLGVAARSRGELVRAVSSDPRRTVIVLPDLHEEEAAGLVLDLARVAHVRLVVESRTGSGAHRLLAGSGCAELDLDLERWRDPESFEQWRASAPEGVAVAASSPPAGEVDLSDATAVCAADPWSVTAGYEKDGAGEHGGLRDAWLSAGQALCAEPSPATRALILLGALGDRADPRYAPALRALAGGAAWDLEWSRVRGDVTPPWPGPVTAVARGRGPLAGCLLVAGVDATVRAVGASDAAARGRVPLSGDRPVSLVGLPDGTVLFVDEHGHVHRESARPAEPERSGIAGLLDDTPTGAQRLAELLRGRRGTDLAYAEGGALGTVVLGDATGAVRAFGDITDSASLHEGVVTGLAALGLPVGDGAATLPLVYSGGADGTVRAWSPGSAPMAGVLMRRSCPVVSLDAAMTASGPTAVVAWADGLVEWIDWASGARRTVRPGPPVRAVALDARGRVFVGTDHALMCFAPRP